MTKRTLHYRGKPLTDELADEIVTESQANLNALSHAEAKARRRTPDQIRARMGRPPIGSAAATQVRVRLEPELHQALDERAAFDHTTASDVMRRALRAYLEAS